MATIYESILSSANKISSTATTIREALKSVPVYLDAEGKAVLDDFGMDFTAEKVKMYLVNPDTDTEVEGLCEGSAHADRIHNYKCICMAHNKHQLGVMTDAYTIVQNRDAFAFVDNMKGISNIKMSYGKVTHTGAHCVVLDAPEVTILGETFIPHIILRNSFNGRYKVSAVMQLEAISNNKDEEGYVLSFGRNVMSTRHMKNVNDRLLAAEHTIGNLYNWIKNIQDLAEDLNKKELTKFELEKVLNHYFPECSRNAYKETIGAKKDEFLALLGEKDLVSYEQKDEFAKVKITAWQLVKTYFRWASTKFFGVKKDVNYADDIFCNLMDKTDYDFLFEMIDADFSNFKEIKEGDEALKGFINPSVAEVEEL